MFLFKITNYDITNLVHIKDYDCMKNTVFFYMRWGIFVLFNMILFGAVCNGSRTYVLLDQFTLYCLFFTFPIFLGSLLSVRLYCFLK